MFADTGHKLYSIHSTQKPAIMCWGMSVTGERKEEYLLLLLQLSLILLLLCYSVWVVWRSLRGKEKKRGLNFV